MSHRLHPDPARNDDPKALMWDDCEDCETRTQLPYILRWDDHHLAEMWDLMVRVEAGTHNYRSRVEAEVGRTLYSVAVMLQRFGFDPFTVGFLYRHQILGRQAMVVMSEEQEQVLKDLETAFPADMGVGHSTAFETWDPWEGHHPLEGHEPGR